MTRISMFIAVISIFVVAEEAKKAAPALKPTPTATEATQVTLPVESTKTDLPTEMTAPASPAKKEIKAEPVKHRSEVVKIDKRRDRVSITDDPQRLWNKKDNVCVYRLNRPLACGKVIAVGIKGAVVQLVQHAANIKAGDEARYFEPDKKIPDIADDQISSEGLMDAKPYTFNIALGYYLSLDLMYPIAHFYWAVSPMIAVGLQPAYISKPGDTATAKLSGFGGLMTANYFGEEYFRGLWVQFGTGFYRLTAEDGGLTETLNVPAIHSLVGWREDWAHGLNVGAGLGARFLSPLSGTLSNIKYSTLHVIAQVELGISF